ncbi:4a-hydroxytetrahydrobiopterin dehydratase [Singulisphaera sp. PoT]|uniref:4a-hydroxytetrahydrobiopterin dehydratase n=1 Tax=Singulisphaera sp. PoT TaxID=3411797 RepID=UPI003BF522E5
MSSTPTAEELVRKHCVPCEGGVEQLSSDRANALLASVEGWELADEGRSIRRKWTAKNFVAAIEFFNAIAELAEKEGHHPDLHLEGYRKVTVEISTHAIGGLSENDFILASKINQLPIKTKG